GRVAGRGPGAPRDCDVVGSQRMNAERGTRNAEHFEERRVARPSISVPHSAFRVPPWGRGGSEAVRLEQLRGGVVEAWHDVHVAVVDGLGRLVAKGGDPDLVSYSPPAAKRFQGLPL